MQRYSRRVKQRYFSTWVSPGFVTAVACGLGALVLSACGEGFTASNGAAGGGGDDGSGARASSGGTSSGGDAHGMAGDADDVGGAESNGSGGNGGGSGDEGGRDSGEAGDGNRDVDAGGAPIAAGGSGGAYAGGGGGGAAGGAAGAGNAGQAGSAGGPAVGVKAFDDFVASAEGWSITGDDMIKTVKYSSTGGRPNGSISATEGSTGTLFFTAPSKYLGDASAYYGGELRFDLKADATMGTFFAYADVELTSNQTTLAYDCTPDATTAWHTYLVPLSEAGWKVTTINGAAATAAQLKAVLANLTRLRIRGEFTNAQDTGYLDNVYFGSQ